MFPFQSSEGGERHRCSDHLQSRILSDGPTSDMNLPTSTPIQHEPHCPRGDNDKTSDVSRISEVAKAARDPESDRGGTNYRTLCQCEGACK